MPSCCSATLFCCMSFSSTPQLTDAVGVSSCCCPTMSTGTVALFAVATDTSDSACCRLETSTSAAPAADGDGTTTGRDETIFSDGSVTVCCSVLVSLPW
uniref:Putative secreted protein n=1 Tax=Anopheles darlingi TaxID=43151 RepID=A0A2M4DJE7_ANODA